MKRNRTNSFWGSHFLVAFGAVALLAFASVSVASAAQVHKRKHLSLANISILNPETASGIHDWVAAARGFFTQQGLNATVVNSPATSAEFVTEEVSGVVNFVNFATSAQIIAGNQGGPLRAVAQSQTSVDQEIAISSAFAAAHNIPVTGDSESTTLSQFLALKGTHIVIAISNSTAEGYSWMLGLAAKNGMTAGLNCTTCDIDLNSLGSVANTIAALNTGKANGLSNAPPNSVQPNTIEIQMHYLKPVNVTAGNYVMTNTTMIQQHADTVQAVVNAYTEAYLYVTKHPNQAEKYAAAQLATFGITSPEEAEYIFTSSFLPFAKNIYPTKIAYETEVSLINAAGNGPITMPYSTYVVTKFAKIADKTFGLPIPSS
jgi:ABC-type nitrate/sulfonate/bicarbonate transport system substrate-binding protein